MHLSSPSSRFFSQKDEKKKKQIFRRSDSTATIPSVLQHSKDIFSSKRSSLPRIPRTTIAVHRYQRSDQSSTSRWKLAGGQKSRFRIAGSHDRRTTICASGTRISPTVCRGARSNFRFLRDSLGNDSVVFPWRDQKIGLVDWCVRQSEKRRESETWRTFHGSRHEKHS